MTEIRQYRINSIGPCLYFKRPVGLFLVKVDILIFLYLHDDQHSQFTICTIRTFWPFLFNIYTDCSLVLSADRHEKVKKSDELTFSHRCCNNWTLLVLYCHLESWLSVMNDGILIINESRRESRSLTLKLDEKS